MENEIQQNLPQVQPPPQTNPIIPASSNWPKILLFVILGLTIASGLVITAIQFMKIQPLNKQPAPSSTPTTSTHLESKSTPSSTQSGVYSIPTNINFVPQSQDSITTPFYTIWIGGFRNIYVTNSEGEKKYYGSDMNKITSGYEKPLSGLRADLASSDGIAKEFLIENIAQTYKFQVSDTVWEKNNIIDIKYGYGNRIDEIYFQLVFKDLLLNNKTFEFSLSPEGVTTTPKYNEFYFDSNENNPIKVLMK